MILGYIKGSPTLLIPVYYPWLPKCPHLSYIILTIHSLPHVRLQSLPTKIHRTSGRSYSTHPLYPPQIQSSLWNAVELVDNQRPSSLERIHKGWYTFSKLLAGYIESKFYLFFNATKRFGPVILEKSRECLTAANANPEHVRFDNGHKVPLHNAEN